MQELQEKQKERQRWLELFADKKEPTAKERTDAMRKLQFEEGKGLFAVAYSTLHKAAMDGNVDALRWFLTGKGRSSGGVKVNVNDFDKGGLCAIHHSAERGHDPSIEYLLKKKASVNAESGNGNTPMHYAAKSNHLSTIRLLHENGGNLAAKNKGGMTPAHFAAQVDNLEALQLLSDLMDKDLDLANEKVLAVQAAREAGEDVGAAAATGGGGGADDATQNSDSVISGDDELQNAVTLLEMPKNLVIDAPSLNRTRPLHLCASFDSRRCLKFLIDKKVDLNSTDFMQETALHKAGRKNYHVAYEMLVKAGGSTTFLNEQHETPAALLQDETQY